MKKNKMLVLLGAICSMLVIASAQEHTHIKEHVLYENIR